MNPELLKILLESGVVPSEARAVINILANRRKRKISHLKNNPEYKRLYRTFLRENAKLKRLETAARNLRENNGVPNNSLPDFQSFIVNKEDLRTTKYGLIYKQDLKNVINNIRKMTKYQFKSSHQPIATYNVLLNYEKNGYSIYIASSDAQASAYNSPEFHQIGINANQFSTAERKYIAKRRPNWFKGVL